jgi:hypothetical protein
MNHCTFQNAFLENMLVNSSLLSGQEGFFLSLKLTERIGKKNLR